MGNPGIVLIPAYQPTTLLLELVREIKSRGFKIIVVDDGSSADSQELFKEAADDAVVLRYPENRGKGHALKTGLDYIQKHFSPEYVVVTMDADGQHRVADAIRICQTAREFPDGLVLGGRALKENVPLRSRIGNTVTRFVYTISTGLRIHDTQTGLRAFSSRLLPVLAQVPGERYEYEMNVLLACARKGIPIREVEIETIYRDHNASSHFDTLKDSCRIYREILKFSASSLVSFLVDYALYSLLLPITAGLGEPAGLVVSNIGARIVSASVNYMLNRKLVFESRSSIGKSAAQYFLLAGNTLILGLLADWLGMNRYAAKLCTEIFFFIVSWLIQRFCIFRRRDV